MNIQNVKIKDKIDGAAKVAVKSIIEQNFAGYAEGATVLHALDNNDSLINLASCIMHLPEGTINEYEAKTSLLKLVADFDVVSDENVSTSDETKSVDERITDKFNEYNSEIELRIAGKPGMTDEQFNELEQYMLSVDKITESYDFNPTLEGSSKLDATYTLSDGTVITLGEIVSAAHAESKLTVKEWNSQPDEEREARIWNMKNTYDIMPEGMMNYTWTEEDIESSEILKEFGFNAGDTVKVFIDTESEGTFIEQHERTIKDISLNELRESKSATDTEKDNESNDLKKIATQEDLDMNPELVEQGVKVGDEIVIPADAIIEDNDKLEETVEETNLINFRIDDTNRIKGKVKEWMVNNKVFADWGPDLDEAVNDYKNRSFEATQAALDSAPFKYTVVTAAPEA